MQPHRLYPTRLLCPWNSPGKNTGVGCHFLLQGIFPTQGWNPRLPAWQVDSLPTEPPGKPLTEEAFSGTPGWRWGCPVQVLDMFAPADVKAKPEEVWSVLKNQSWIPRREKTGSCPVAGVVSRGACELWGFSWASGSKGALGERVWGHLGCSEVTPASGPGGPSSTWRGQHWSASRILVRAGAPFVVCGQGSALLCGYRT